MGERRHGFSPQLMRIIMVDALLEDYGHVCRSDLISRFGISQPQASKDFTEFKRQFPMRMQYNSSSKRYEAGCSSLLTQETRDAVRRATFHVAQIGSILNGQAD